MKYIFRVLLLLLIIESCHQNQAEESKTYYCDKRITAMNIDSLPLYKSFSDYDAFLDISDDVKTCIKGNVQEISECHYKKSHRFDEDILTQTSEIIIQFNDQNQMVKSITKLTPDGSQYVSAENTYSDKNKLISKGSFEEKYKTLNQYSYTENGQLQSIKTKWDFSSKNLSDRIMSNIDWGSQMSYYYNDSGMLNKEVQTYFGGDSCVVKYDYVYGSNGPINQIIKYNKSSGNREYITNLNYDEKKNRMTATTWNVLFSFSYDETNEKNLDNQIVVYFNNNCKVSKVTKVKKRDKNFKRYTKVDFNDQGDLVSKSEILYPNSSENDFNFNYLEEFDSKYILEPQYEYYEYVYDNYGNWIERTNGEDVIKRKIVYKN